MHLIPENSGSWWYHDRDYHVFHGDCIEHMKDIPEKSIDFSVFSPPFPAVFSYSSSPADLGNSEELRYEARIHFSYFFNQIIRVMKPGRVMVVHCTQIVRMKRTGEEGLYDFRGLLIRLAVRAGFIYDYDWVVRQGPQQQAIRTRSRRLQFQALETNRLGSCGANPDYLIKFYVPGEAEVPVNSEDQVSRNDWIDWAECTWDISNTDTLNAAEGRSEDDVRHICPLALPIINRLVRLYSNPGEIVFSPFTGIGSEGYESIKLNRRFYGCELKPEYHAAALKNLERAIEARKSNQVMLWDLTRETERDERVERVERIERVERVERNEGLNLVDRVERIERASLVNIPDPNSLELDDDSDDEPSPPVATIPVTFDRPSIPTVADFPPGTELNKCGRCNALRLRTITICPKCGCPEYELKIIDRNGSGEVVTQAAEEPELKGETKDEVEGDVKVAPKVKVTSKRVKKAEVKVKAEPSPSLFGNDDGDDGDTSDDGDTTISATVDEDVDDDFDWGTGKSKDVPITYIPPLELQTPSDVLSSTVLLPHDLQPPYQAFYRDHDGREWRCLYRLLLGGLASITIDPGQDWPSAGHAIRVKPECLRRDPNQVQTLAENL